MKQTTTRATKSASSELNKLMSTFFTDEDPNAVGYEKGYQNGYHDALIDAMNALGVEGCPLHPFDFSRELSGHFIAVQTEANCY